MQPASPIIRKLEIVNRGRISKAILRISGASSLVSDDVGISSSNVISTGVPCLLYLVEIDSEVLFVCESLHMFILLFICYVSMFSVPFTIMLILRVPLGTKALLL